MEEFIGFIAPYAEDGEDAIQSAAAVKAERAGLEEVGFLGLLDYTDVFSGQRIEPFEVGIRLGGNQNEIFILEAKCASRSLLGLMIELGDPFNRIPSIDLEGGHAWLA